jgi:hypothetical protein
MHPFREFFCWRTSAHLYDWSFSIGNRTGREGDVIFQSVQWVLDRNFQSCLLQKRDDGYAPEVGQSVLDTQKPYPDAPGRPFIIGPFPRRHQRRMRRTLRASCTISVAFGLAATVWKAGCIYTRHAAALAATIAKTAPPTNCWRRFPNWTAAFRPCAVAAAVKARPMPARPMRHDPPRR